MAEKIWNSSKMLIYFFNIIFGFLYKVKPEYPKQTSWWSQMRTFHYNVKMLHLNLDRNVLFYFFIFQIGFYIHVSGDVVAVCWVLCTSFLDVSPWEISVSTLPLARKEKLLELEMLLFEQCCCWFTVKGV